MVRRTDIQPCRSFYGNSASSNGDAPPSDRGGARQQPGRRHGSTMLISATRAPRFLLASLLPYITRRLNGWWCGAASPVRACRPLLRQSRSPSSISLRTDARPRRQSRPPRGQSELPSYHRWPSPGGVEELIIDRAFARLTMRTQNARPRRTQREDVLFPTYGC